jgi:prepilin-type N-terminal cleavage/methylation domain-containing protein
MELANSRCVMRARQAGFTLIEMMIVVAIMGVLAGIAVYAYRKVTSTTEIDSEVHAIFAEFRVRQEEYHAETGTYRSTGVSDANLFPGLPRKPGDAPVDIAPVLAAATGGPGMDADAWVDLRMRPRMSTLRCGYVAIAGAPNVPVPGFGGGVLQMNVPAPPETNWYYLVARCDADGDSGTDSFYLARHDREDVLNQNKGK